MQVIFDLRHFHSGHWQRGVGCYIKNLTSALRQQGVDLTIIEKGVIPEATQIIHYPYFDLFFPTLPFRKEKPVVVTIHDVIPLVFPEKFPSGLKGWFNLQRQKLSLYSVSAIITDSENSKKDIIKHLGVAANKIYVVYLAPAEEFRKFSIKKKYFLPDKFILYVGDVNWNKNIPGLIKACAKTELPLVLIGKAFENKDLPEVKNLLRLIKELNLNKRIKILGFVPENDLVAIYNLAAVYCQPSFYEGFGLPVLEAMVCGTPVVASQTASLPEICGQAAIMVKPDDVDSLVQGINEALKKREILIKKGLEQVKKFTWQKTAQETIKVYNEILKRKSENY